MERKQIDEVEIYFEEEKGFIKFLGTDGEEELYEIHTAPKDASEFINLVKVLIPPVL